MNFGLELEVSQHELLYYILGKIDVDDVKHETSPMTEARNQEEEESVVAHELIFSKWLIHITTVYLAIIIPTKA